MNACAHCHQTNTRKKPQPEKDTASERHENEIIVDFVVVVVDEKSHV